MIIGICGLSGSGKDTVGAFLRKGYGFESIAFADPMKRFCAELFDWDEERLWGPSERRNEPDPRYVRSVERVGSFLGPRSDQTPSPAREKVPTELTARHALQQLGTEWGRACYPGVWVDYALRLAKKLDGSQLGYSRLLGPHRMARGPCPGVTITDVRFRNEVEAVKAAGGKVWRIVRPRSGLQGAAALHVSETEMAALPDAAFDRVIQNDGTLEDLEKKAADALVLHYRT